jgi:hypothetical protein
LSAQEFEVRLGVQNASQAHLAGDETFYGQMELRYADGAQAGELRAGAEIVSLAPLSPGETAWPLVWRGQLDSGAYTLTWGTEGDGTTTVEFQVAERSGRPYLGT